MYAIWDKQIDDWYQEYNEDIFTYKTKIYSKKREAIEMKSVAPYPRHLQIRKVEIKECE